MSIDLSHTLPAPSVPGDFIFHTPLFACDLSDPPEFMWQNPAGTYGGPPPLCEIAKYIYASHISIMHLVFGSINCPTVKVEENYKRSRRELLRSEICAEIDRC